MSSFSINFEFTNLNENIDPAFIIKSIEKTKGHTQTAEYKEIILF